METRPPTRELALLLLLATLWAASYSLIRVGVATIPPLTFAAARTAIAGTVLWACIAAQGIAIPRDGALWRNICVQALLNSVFPFTLIAWAELAVSGGLATILNSTTPIFTLVATALFTRHEAVPRRKSFGAACGLVGVCLLIGRAGFAGLGGDLVAQIAIVVASVSYACAAIFGQRFNGISALLPAAGSMTVGAVLLGPASLIVDRPWNLSVSTSSLLALFGLAIFSTALAYVIYFRLMKTLGSIGTTTQSFLRVPIGVAISAAFLGERLTTMEWLGALSVAIGVGALTLPGPRTLKQVMTQ
jgi:drug/metabolite transporter (DMT)-like permease